MEIHFNVTPARIREEDLTVGELVMIEDRAEFSVKAMRDYMARFMTDEKGIKLTHEQAKKVLNRLNGEQFMDAFIALGKALTADAVPPNSASASS